VTTTDSAANPLRLEQAVIEGLRSRIRGAVIGPGDPGYDETRQVWNAMIDRFPALIVQCLGATDVVSALSFAREQRLSVSVRGGGHNIAGSAVCDGGLMIDLSRMKVVKVDPGREWVQVEPGVRLAELDQETQALGMAVPAGVTSTTGIAGLTLGGGLGWLTRKYGLTVDSLLAADVVLADGRQVRASIESEPDLFWALRGGGGNFGVVTNFQFQLRPVGPEIFAGLVVFPHEEARSVLREYREYVRDLPEESSLWAILRQAPQLPFLPSEVHGRQVLALALFHAGTEAEGAGLAEPLRRFGKPYGEFFAQMPFTAWQQSFDALVSPPARNYWKSHNLTELRDAAIEKLIAHAAALPSGESELLLGLAGGESSRVPVDATAYAGRAAQFVLSIHARWQEAADDERAVVWARETFESLAPHASGGAYVNFMAHDEADRVAAAYGPNYARLVEVKRRYDPENFFRANQNIAPSV
jgi:FAD/FMN-containing dehydrogenase